MSFCYFSLTTWDIIQLTYQHKYQFVGKVMTNVYSTKETIYQLILGISKGMENAISISIVPDTESWIRNENVVYVTKNVLKISYMQSESQAHIG